MFDNARTGSMTAIRVLLKPFIKKILESLTLDRQARAAARIPLHFAVVRINRQYLDRFPRAPVVWISLKRPDRHVSFWTLALSGSSCPYIVRRSS
jgi:hypothetical protein